MQLAGTKKGLMGLWVADFLARYKPEAEDHNHAKMLYGQLAFNEGRTGYAMLTDEWEHGVPKESLYMTGEQIAKHWNVPITQIGLTALILGCHEPDDVMMLMAVCYQKFLEQGPPADQPLDALLVGTILKLGTPTRKFLKEMWKTQAIESNDHSPKWNLLDSLQATDFKSR
jgi:hypothetical protein